MPTAEPFVDLEHAHALPARYYFGEAMLEREHEAVFAVQSLPDGAACYAGQVLVIGTPLPLK